MIIEERVQGYEFDGFVVDTRRRGVWRPDGTPVRLTAQQFNTLLLFVERPGELLRKDWLLDALWPGMDVGENSLSQAICSLRRALASGGRRYIQTESRQGFRFVCPVKALRPVDAAPAGAPPAVLETLSYILAMQDAIMRHLAMPTLGESGGRAPSRTPAYPL